MSVSSTLEISPKKLQRQLIKFVIPTIAQEICFPLFVLFDTGLVGHILGTLPLAGLTVASSVHNFLFGIFIFASYVTNAQVSKLLGANKKKDAIRAGIDTIWLSFTIGVVVGVILNRFAPEICMLFNPEDEVKWQAVAYLQWVSVGLPGILLILATNGFLRAFKKVKFLMWTAVVSILLNVCLELFFVVVCDMQIAGSGFGTGLCNLVWGVTQTVYSLRIVHREKVSRRPNVKGALEALKDSTWIIVRSLNLWMAISWLVRCFTSQGVVQVAALQVVDTIWGLELVAIEAVGIAIQSFVGQEIGAGDKVAVKRMLSAAMRLGMKVASVIAVINLIGIHLFPAICTPDADVQAVAAWGIFESALIIFHATYAFLMDGAMIASGDQRSMALIVIASFAIFAVASTVLVPMFPQNGFGFFCGLATYDCVFLGCRAFFAKLRRDNDRWLKPSGL